MADQPNQPRQPKDLRGLLKFCMEATKGEDAPSSQFTEMDEERRKWLNEALQSMTDDPIKKLQAALELIASADEDGSDSMENAFEVVVDFCEDLDMANDFVKIGGFNLMKELLNRPSPVTRACAAEVVAVCSQNNPYCQTAALDAGLLPVLLRLLDEDSDPNTRFRALSAVSSLARSSEDGQKAFVSNDGFSVLLRAMQGDVQRIKIKAAFMISATCDENQNFKDALTNMGMMTQLTAFLSTDDVNFREKVLGAMCSLCRDNRTAIQHLSEANVEHWLEQHSKKCKGKEELQEDAEYCDQLLLLLRRDDAVDTPIR